MKQHELKHISLRRLSGLKTDKNMNNNDYWLKIPEQVLKDLDVRPYLADIDMRVILINDRVIDTLETAPQ